jgi:hypothetical protein
LKLSESDPELQALIEKIGVVSPRQAGLIDGVGQSSVNKRLKSGEYESFLDGSSRKITLRSIMARRANLLAAANKQFTPSRPTPPSPKSAAGKAAKRLREDATT